MQRDTDTHKENAMSRRSLCLGRYSGKLRNTKNWRALEARREALGASTRNQSWQHLHFRLLASELWHKKCSTALNHPVGGALLWLPYRELTLRVMWKSVLFLHWLGLCYCCALCHGHPWNVSWWENDFDVILLHLEPGDMPPAPSSFPPPLSWGYLKSSLTDKSMIMISILPLKTCGSFSLSFSYEEVFREPFLVNAAGPQIALEMFSKTYKIKRDFSWLERVIIDFTHPKCLVKEKGPVLRRDVGGVAVQGSKKEKMNCMLWMMLIYWLSQNRLMNPKRLLKPPQQYHCHLWYLELKRLR